MAALAARGSLPVYDQRRRMPSPRRSAMPGRIAPQLVRPAPTPPAGEAWVHEV